LDFGIGINFINNNIFLRAMKKKVLVVDDDQNIAELVKNVLELEGFEVRIANSGKNCMMMLVEFQPDLILLDIRMPDMSGIEVAKEMKKDKANEKRKIVFLSAHYGDVAKEDLKDLRIKEFIEKPFENNELVEKIKKVIKDYDESKNNE